MSLQFSDTTNKNGVVQHIERTVGFNDGDITGNTLRFQQVTADVNMAKDELVALILSADKSRNVDDFNHTKYPIITIDLVANQRDYSFTQDEQSNFIVHIHKVMVADSGGVFRTIEAVNQQDTGTEQDRFQDGQNTTGTPEYYDQTADGLFLDPIPSYNSTGGLKVFIDREGSHYTTSSTIETSGLLPLFDEYLVLKPSYRIARDMGLPNRNDLKRDMLEMRAYIEDFVLRNQNAQKQGLRVDKQWNK